MTHNDALRGLDPLVQASAHDLCLPLPETPKEGDCIIVSAQAENDLLAHRDCLGAYQDGAWTYLAPRRGWRCWVEATGALYVYDGNGWTPAVPSSPETAPVWGINTTADTFNRLRVKSDATLLDKDGAGHRLKFNKTATSDTASLIFQTGYSGRAELGLAGSDNLQIKVSENGSNWIDALSVMAPGGHVVCHTTLSRGGHTVLDTGNTPGVIYMRGDIGDAEDLDDYITSGLWHQRLNTRAANGQNYPVDQAGLLSVFGIASMVYQTYRVYSAASGGVSDATYTRGSYDGVWSAWQKLSTETV